MKTLSLWFGVGFGMITLVSASPMLIGAEEEVIVALPSPPPTAVVTAQPTSVTVLAERLKTVNVSPSIREIVKMADAGMDAAVLEAFIENSPIAYSPRPDELIYLHEHGVGSPVITAMIQHGAKMREQMVQAAPVAQPSPPTAAPQVQAPAPTYVVQTPTPTIVESPSYVYSSPSVVYFPASGCYYPRSYYSAPYFGFRYSSGWSSPYVSLGFRGGYRGGFSGHGGFVGRGGFGGFSHHGR
jgi:hypothetical protein